MTEADVAAYVAALTHTGFFGADSFYMNHGLNAEYARTAVNDGKLDMPVLFLGAQYDYVCETFDSNLAEPMRELCSALTEHMIPSGHWMAQEQPVAVNSALVAWLARSIPYLWPDGFVEHPQPA